MVTLWKINGWNPKSWRFGSDDFPFQLGGFEVVFKQPNLPLYTYSYTVHIIYNHDLHHEAYPLFGKKKESFGLGTPPCFPWTETVISQSPVHQGN